MKSYIIEAKPYSMKNTIQQYAWGKRGAESFIPRLLGTEPDGDTPYAELWMGAHPKASSTIELNGEQVALTDLIDACPEDILGSEVIEKFGKQLPFLFKVLSIGQPLSIQAHPEKQQAVELHARDPGHYPDPNHKPEIAIALDSLTALVGFKKYSDICNMLKDYPEIADFIGNPDMTIDSEGNGAEVKALFIELLKRSAADFDGLLLTLESLADRLADSPGVLSEEAQLFLESRKTYSGSDVGLFAIFFMDLVHLKPGEGVFLEAGVPHAYLRGNIIECMANSDNVVRVGLTPKFKDVDSLIEIIHCNEDAIPVISNQPGVSEIIYTAPVAEFQVVSLRLNQDLSKAIETDNKPEILLVTNGSVTIQWHKSGQMVIQAGQSVFIPALMTGYTLKGRGRAEMFRVHVPGD